MSRYTIIYKYDNRARQLKFKITRRLKIKRKLENVKLSHYGIWANLKYKSREDLSHILGAFLIKQLFH